jgi:hypothetical protein
VVEKRLGVKEIRAADVYMVVAHGEKGEGKISSLSCWRGKSRRVLMRVKDDKLDTHNPRAREVYLYDKGEELVAREGFYNAIVFLWSDYKGKRGKLKDED